MPTVTCPICGHTYSVADVLARRRIKCAQCDATLLVPPVQPSVPVSPPPAPLPAAQPHPAVRFRWAPIIRGAVWGSCLGYALWTALAYDLLLEKTRSAFQETAVATWACARLLFALVVAVSLDSLVLVWSRPSPKSDA